MNKKETEKLISAAMTILGSRTSAKKKKSSAANGRKAVARSVLVAREGEAMTEDSTVALYARVSTLDKGQDVGMQLRELREHCIRREWIVAGEYIDNGVSGSKESRPQLNKLMADAGRRKFDVSLCLALR